MLENDGTAAHLTGPMKCELVAPSFVDSIVDRLGPDPLRNGAAGREFARRISSTGRPIGEVLLDQRVIAGIGNVYRAEILFLCGLHPGRAASDLSLKETTEVWRTARAELRRGLADGRIITVRPRDVGAGRRALLPERLRRYVYKREHRSCLRCGTPIRSTSMGGRSIWWCPSCQPAT